MSICRRALIAALILISGVALAAEDDSTCPDATFTLRLSCGAVQGYVEDGKRVAPFTDIAGSCASPGMALRQLAHACPHIRLVGVSHGPSHCTGFAQPSGDAPR